MYNADESGFNLGIHSGRAMHNTRAKTVEVTVQSLFSLIHSYTITPVISASGQLISPFYLVLKERTDSLGLQVQEILLKLLIFILSSKLGKLTSVTTLKISFNISNISIKYWRTKLITNRFMDKTLSSRNATTYTQKQIQILMILRKNN